MYALIWTPRFTRAAKKFIQSHSELKIKFAAILRDLERDPFQPHIKFHQLSDKLKGIQAVSLTESCRITLTVVISDKKIVLLDVGSHDDVYR